MASEKSQQLYLQMKRDITGMPPDTRLQSIRALMRSYSVSQLLIDRTLGRLRDEGLLRKRSDGLYTYLCEEADTQAIALITSNWPSTVRMEQQECLKRRAARRNLRILPFTHSFRASFRSIRQQENLKAILISPPSPLNTEDIEQIQNSRIPILIINHQYGELNLNFVSPSYFEGGMLAAEHLIRNGHRKLALLFSQPHNWCINQRAAGFLTTAELLGAKVRVLDVQVQNGEIADRKVYPYLMNFLRRKKPDFTALAALCDCTAKTAICALAASGYTTPDDISVIGIEGLNASQYFLPPLTSVGVDLAHYMDTILDTVEELLRNPEQRIQITEPQKVFERNSVKPFFSKQEKEHEKR
mgnify:CR=1 FL=1